jgi:hypothetical protein
MIRRRRHRQTNTVVKLTAANTTMARFARETGKPNAQSAARTAPSPKALASPQRSVFRQPVTRGARAIRARDVMAAPKNNRASTVRTLRSSKGRANLTASSIPATTAKRISQEVVLCMRLHVELPPNDVQRLVRQRVRHAAWDGPRSQCVTGGGGGARRSVHWALRVEVMRTSQPGDENKACQRATVA